MRYCNFFFFLDNKGFLLTYSTDIIENCLFILWRHLDFYFLRCIPSDEERRILAGPPLISSQMRRLHGSVVLLLLLSFLELTVALLWHREHSWRSLDICLL